MMAGPDRITALVSREVAAWVVMVAIALHAASALMILAAMALAVGAGVRAGLPRGWDARAVAAVIFAFGMVAALTGLSLAAPFRILPVSAVSIVSWLDAVRLWHVGGGVLAFLLTVAAVTIATFAAGSALPETGHPAEVPR